MFEMNSSSAPQSRSLVVCKDPLSLMNTHHTLTVGLAQTSQHLKNIQKLRYKVFYQEMNATPTLQMKLKKRDFDRYDPLCKHLMVIDNHPKFQGKFLKTRQEPVGTYRLLEEDVAAKYGGFYSNSQFDLSPLLKRKQSTHKFLELGRSCVLKPYRNKRTIERLWQGLWHYIRQTNVGAVIGCASFSGTDLDQHREALSFLYHFASAPAEWSASAHPHLFQSMNLIKKEDIHQKRAIQSLPPLIKAYMRIGAKIGNGAVIDKQFGTIDVLVVLPVETVNPRYAAYFSHDKSAALQH